MPASAAVHAFMLTISLMWWSECSTSMLLTGDEAARPPSEPCRPAGPIPSDRLRLRLALRRGAPQGLEKLLPTRDEVAGR